MTQVQARNWLSSNSLQDRSSVDTWCTEVNLSRAKLQRPSAKCKSVLSADELHGVCEANQGAAGPCSAGAQSHKQMANCRERKREGGKEWGKKGDVYESSTQSLLDEAATVDEQQPEAEHPDSLPCTN